MPLRREHVGSVRLVHGPFDLRWRVVTERLLWWSLIALGILGTMLFLGLFGVLLWGLFWGMPAR